MNQGNNIILICLSIGSIILLIVNEILHLRYTIFQSIFYSMAFPISGFVICTAFIASIISAQQKDAILWRDRRYPIKDKS